MDDIVKQAMAKWPNVPAVFGWLSLDRRGNWLLKGETISNPQINEFIRRNYLHDDEGRWYFQNGPQRVFVELACAPYVFSLEGQQLLTHTQHPVRAIERAWLDDTGTLLLLTEHGVGSVNDRDLDLLLPHFVDAQSRPLDEDTLETLFDACAAQQPVALWFQLGGAHVKIEPIRAADVPRQFGFQRQPQEQP